MRRTALVTIVAALGAFGTGAGVHAGSAGPAGVDPDDVALALAKTASSTTAAPGVVVVYTYVLTNTGSEPLSDVALDDDKLGEIPLPSDTLAPGESLTVTADYQVRPEDAGTTIVNTAGAVANGPVTPPVSIPDEVLPGASVAVRATATASVSVDGGPPAVAGVVVPAGPLSFTG